MKYDPYLENPYGYLITFSTYGSWLHGNKRGSVDRHHNAPGSPYLGRNEARANRCRALQKTKTYRLSEERREIVKAAIKEVCHRRGWTLHALHVRVAHVHIVITASDAPGKVRGTLKAIASARLAETEDREGRRWSRGGSVRYLWSPEAVEEAIIYVLGPNGSMAGSPA